MGCECNFTPDFVWILKKPCRNWMYLRRIFDLTELEMVKIIYTKCSWFISHSIVTYLLTYFLTYLLTYLLIPWSRVLLEKLISSQLVRKFPAFYGIRRFITTSTSLLSLFWARSIQSMPPHPTSWRSILILSSHLRLGLPSGLFSSCFQTKPYMHNFCPPPLKRSTCPAHLILSDLVTRTILDDKYRSLSFALCSFLIFLVTSPLLRPNIPLKTLFSNTLSLRFYLRVSDQVSNPYNTTEKKYSSVYLNLLATDFCFKF